MLAWGTIAEVLASAYVREILADEEHEGDFDDLVAAIDEGEFDACDPEQFAKALEALAEVERS